MKSVIPQKIFLLFILFIFLSIPHTYGMTPQDLQGKISTAKKVDKLPHTDIWKELPEFLSDRKVSTQIRASLSKESSDALFEQDWENGLVGGIFSSLPLWGLCLILEPRQTRTLGFVFYSSIYLGSHGFLNGAGTAIVHNVFRRTSFLQDYPWASAPLKFASSLLPTFLLNGAFYLLPPNSPTRGNNFVGGIFVGVINSLTASFRIEKNHIPSYKLLTEDDREALLKTYIYAKKPELTDLLETAERGQSLQRHDLELPRQIKFGTTRPTAMQLYQGPLRDFFVASAFNGSELAYELEDNPTLRANSAVLLNHMNKELIGTPWLGVECFDVVTGNYGRFQAGKPSRAFLGMSWKKQPAVVAWGRPPNHPGIILVAFKGTNFSSHADQISDIKFRHKALKQHGFVHAGFFDIADSGAVVQSQKLAEICQKLGKGNKGIQILYTGHSMGAAVSLISAFMAILKKAPFSNNDHNENVVINFGQPRVCGQGSKTNFEGLLGRENLIRFVAEDEEGRKDPITGYRGNTNDTFKFEHFGYEVPLKCGKKVRTTLIGGVTSIHPLSSYRKGWENSQKK